MKPLRVLLCHPGVREPWPLVIEEGLESLQALVGGLIECVKLTHEFDGWINEEGRLLGLPPNRLGLVGPIVVARSDEDGRTCSLDDLDVHRLRLLLHGY